MAYTKQAHKVRAYEAAGKALRHVDSAIAELRKVREHFEAAGVDPRLRGVILNLTMLRDHLARRQPKVRIKTGHSSKSASDSL